MRVASHASEQYRRNALAVRQRESVRTEPQASVKTTLFGFRLGKFGLDYESQSTTLDPSLSRDVREQKKQAQAFRAEREVESLRAEVGASGAVYRDYQGSAQSDASSGDSSPSLHRIKTALAAYAKSTEDILPPPGNMLASVV
ncbi:hypothetical protein GM415_04425 [Pseudodesulfovibrio cashew]|uniref:Uncharacterized protein n=1 Tax=Pseudodesulfovibrio cashew TaxID=2678688 RepID=A0A6I6J995_9BACT|nr:hypothetical protein [Pseudodesulfovibrio cashew]QGY39396.1 hypothetical protein GM415_04425 [Pseudodesulfovibrio cashew]